MAGGLEAGCIDDVKVETAVEQRVVQPARLGEDAEFVALVPHAQPVLRSGIVHEGDVGHAAQAGQPGFAGAHGGERRAHRLDLPVEQGAVRRQVGADHEAPGVRADHGGGDFQVARGDQVPVHPGADGIARLHGLVAAVSVHLVGLVQRPHELRLEALVMGGFGLRGIVGGKRVQRGGRGDEPVVVARPVGTDDQVGIEAPEQRIDIVQHRHPAVVAEAKDLLAQLRVVGVPRQIAPVPGAESRLAVRAETGAGRIHVARTVGIGQAGDVEKDSVRLEAMHHLLDFAEDAVAPG